MRNVFRLIVMAAVTLAALHAAPPAQDVKYGIGTWDPESGPGNHKAVVRVEALPPGRMGVYVKNGPKPVMTAEFSKAAAFPAIRADNPAAEAPARPLLSS